MNLQYRIDLLCRLGNYILADGADWQQCKESAGIENGWFTRPFTDGATMAIATQFLSKPILTTWAQNNAIPPTVQQPKKVGIVMAGNIPMVGFHDLLCVFISGHVAAIKLSSKDGVLLKHLINQLIAWEPAIEKCILFPDRLQGCDAYIATGSNNSSRYFEYYFAKYPHIIRKNRTSVALLTGNETVGELDALADDVYLYFGLGCRNVTKLFVPTDYDFVPLLRAFDKYNYLANHHKLKNNYDYNLALHLLNKQYYMTNGSILLVENTAIFSPISQLNYEFYQDYSAALQQLQKDENVQCIVANECTPFGKAQNPSVSDYADGIDTIAFLNNLR
ncbi:MAG: hypothetical protein RIR12_2062 [Bacteroidota bacterium]|jgi:hypothetical protein